MVDIRTIPKDAPQNIASNWQKLRINGIKSLETLGSEVWTDYNIHDPGITILEVLCYALTDLSYRINFPIQDLLAREKGQEEQKDFFEAVEILPTAPVTINDWRKLIIDCFVNLDEELRSDDPDHELCFADAPILDRPVIKNAWINKGTFEGPNIYLHKNYHFSKEVVEVIANLAVNLLYRKEIYEKAIFPELVDQDMLEEFEYCIHASKANGDEKNGWKVELIAALNTLFNSLEFSNLFYMKLKEEGVEDKNLVFKFQDLKQLINRYIEYFFDVVLTDQDFCQIEKRAFKSSTLSYKHPKIEPKDVSLENLGPINIDIDFGPGNKVFTENYEFNFCPLQLNGLYKIQLELIEEINPQNIDAVNKIKKAVREKLNANRGLCEDFLEIEIVGVQKIGLCAEVEIEESADKEEVQAKMFVEIQEFLTPTVNFYSFEELRAKGKSCEEIFNGPILDHGFLLDEELGLPQLRSVVYESDLLQVVMDIPGVVAVKTLKLFHCQGEELVKESIEDWCLKISENHKAVLEVECSEVKFKVGNLFTRSEDRIFKEKLSLLKKLKENPIPENRINLGLEKGTFRNLNKYYSFQNHFPSTYYLGHNGIPPSASNLRKAQAKQLKGYLMLFDQLFANYLAQLSEVKNIFSISQNVDQGTFFSRLLSEQEIPGFDELFMPLRKVEFYCSGNVYDEFKDQLNNYIFQGKQIKNISIGRSGEYGIITDNLEHYWFSDEVTLTIIQQIQELIDSGEDINLKSVSLGARSQYIIQVEGAGVYFKSAAFPQEISNKINELEMEGVNTIQVVLGPGDKFGLITDREEANWYFNFQSNELSSALNRLSEEGITIDSATIGINNQVAFVMDGGQKFWVSENTPEKLKDTLESVIYNDKIIQQIEFGFDGSYVVLAAEENTIPETEDRFSRNVRKNQILDHLIARFGEEFADYAILLFNASSRQKLDFKTKKIEEIIREKATFLSCLPEISKERSMGYNYKSLKEDGTPDMWNSGNVSGLKKRVYKYLGWSNYDRVTLSCVPDYKVNIIPEITRGTVEGYRIRLLGKGSTKVLLEGTKQYTSKTNAQKAGRELFTQALNLNNYRFRLDDREEADINNLNVGENREEIHLILKNYNGNTIAQSEFLNKSEALKRFNTIKSLAFTKECTQNGFHLIEHILLRPQGHQSYEILQPFKITCDCTVDDPYSFWITVIVPEWHEHFNNENSKSFFGHILRRETPAHIGIRVLFLDNEAMYKFESIHRSFIEENSLQKPNERILVNHQNRLVQFLNEYKDKCVDPNDLDRAELKCVKVLGIPRQRVE